MVLLMLGTHEAITLLDAAAPLTLENLMPGLHAIISTLLMPGLHAIISTLLMPGHAIISSLLITLRSPAMAHSQYCECL